MICRRARLSVLRLGLGFGLSLSLALASLASPAFGQGTQLWTVSGYQGLEGGQAHNVAVASDGLLRPGPASKLLYTSPATYIWAVAADSAGNAYLATGSPAEVVRVTPAGKATVLFETKKISVQAIAVGPDGDIYAATMPEGKVYRLDPNTPGQTPETATVVFDSTQVTGSPKYIWSLLFGPHGDLYIATGEPGSIYRVAQHGTPQLFFKSDEPHLRSLAFAPNGDLLAGSDGSGLVYRISPAGKGYVLFNAPEKEITSIAVAPDGTAYVAGVGGKGRTTLPPLPAGSGGSGAETLMASITILAAGGIPGSNDRSLLPDGTAIFSLAPNGTPALLWTSSNAIVYALHWTRQGLLAASGNHGRVYLIGGEGSVANSEGQFTDLAHLEASQATSFAATSNGLYVATANSGKLYSLSNTESADSSYTSDVFDAGVFTLWGRAELATTTPSLVQMFARAGNVANPRRGWSDWQAVSPNQANLDVPRARFVQWKLELKPGAAVRSVGINYLPINVAPMIAALEVKTGVAENSPIAASSAPLTLPELVRKDQIGVHWHAVDPNGDKLVYSLSYRGLGQQNWLPLKDNLSADHYVFPANLLPDGQYQIRLVASDAPSNPPGQALTNARISDLFMVDTTPPTVTQLSALRVGNQLHLTFTATDSTSPLASAFYSIDAGPWQYIEPVGQLSDSRTEHYDVMIPLPKHEAAPTAETPDPAEHLVTVRVRDRYENTATASTLTRSGA